MNFVKCPISCSLVDKIFTNSQSIVSLTYCTLYSLNHSDSALSSPLRSQTPRCPAMTLDSPIACSPPSLTFIQIRLSPRNRHKLQNCFRLFLRGPRWGANFETCRKSRHSHTTFKTVPPVHYRNNRLILLWLYFDYF